MHRLRRDLSSLPSLLTFEAAARRESFTHAADELGVTQAAVSRRIKLLETEVGRPLFERANRRVRLTAAGRTLHDAVARSFDAIADAVADLKADPVEVTIAVSVAFAHFRLLPALSSFREAAPDVDLRVVSSDAWSGRDDTRFDVAVRYGTPPFHGMAPVGSLPEGIVPVCAPEVARHLEAVGADRDAVVLAGGAGVPLIDCDVAEPGWMTWSAWLARQGQGGRSARSRLRFSSYSDGVYAAMEGQGVVLGWTELLRRPLADGRLVPLRFLAVRPEERHWLVVPKRSGRSARFADLVTWIEGAFEGWQHQPGERDAGSG